MAEISVTAAFGNIWERLKKAVAEGKKKAGVTEDKPGVMEAADDIFGSDDDSDESDDVFGNTEPSDAGSQGQSGVEIVSDDTDTSEQDVFGGNEPKPTTSSRRKITGKLTDDKPATTKGKDLREQWKANKEEISSQILALFNYAKENAQYLKDNNEEFITKDELRAIFVAEYMNYTSSDGQNTATTRAINRVSDIFEKKADEIHAKFNARLHGKSTASAKSGGEEFLSGGSLMSYLQSPARKQEEKHPILRPHTKLVYGGEEGICNFILADDLEACKDVIIKILGRKTGMPVDKFNQYVSNLAIDILANGLAGKEGLQQKLGGNIVSAFKRPRYGSIEKDGDNVAILGGKEFLTAFKNKFNSYVAGSMDFLADEFDDIPDPEITQAVNKKGNNRLGVFKVSYPDKPYFDKINLAVDEGIIIPIAFNVGLVSMNAGSTRTSSGTEEGYADRMQGHIDADGAESGDINLGEIAASNELLGVLNEPAAQALAEQLGITEDWQKAVENMDNIPVVSKFTAELLAKLATKAGIPFDIKHARNAYAVNLHTDKSFINLYKASDSNLKLDGDWFKVSKTSGGKTKTPETVVRLAATFNDFILGRVKKVQKGTDIADYTDMGEEELSKQETQATLREKLIPTVHIGDMAEECFSNPSDATLDFIKAYLLVYTGMAAGFKENEKGIFQNPVDFAKKLQHYGLNVNLDYFRADNVKALIDSIDLDDVETWGEIYEKIAEGAKHSNDRDDDEGSAFFNSRDIVPANKLGTTILAKALMFDNPEKYSNLAAAVEYLMSVVDFVIGAKDGFISSYLALVTSPSSKLDASLLKDIIPAAREIKKHGGNMVTITLSDSSDEKYTYFNKK